MRISPIHETSDTPAQPSGGSLTERVRRYFGDQDQKPKYEPVAPRALILGRFIADSFDFTRLSMIDVGLTNSPSRPSPDDIHDYRYDALKPSWALTEPIARLRLYGKNYNKEVGNDFMGAFGVFNLSDGTRLIQVAPSEYGAIDDFGVPDSTITRAGVRSSLQELFGQAYDPQLEEYARLNLGFIREDGEFDAIRPFNEAAFGTKNLTTLLNVLGTAAVEGDLHIQVDNNQIRQYP